MSNRAARIITYDEYPQWDELVRKSPQGTIFHTSKWMSTCSELSSKRGIIFGYFKKDQLLGGCLVYFHKRYNYLSIATSNAQLTPYGGFVLAPLEHLKVREKESIQFEIISAINKEMIQMFDTITLVNSPELSDIRPFTSQGWSEQVKYLYMKSLKQDILFNVSSQVRKNIRKAQNFGITVKKEYNPDLFWVLTKKTYEKQNMPTPFQKEYLFGLMTMLIHNNLGEMWIAWTADGEPASADFIIWDQKQAHRWMAASDEQFKETSATSLLIFKIFEDLQKRDFHNVNMMSGNLSNLSAFSSSFSPELIPYYKVEKKLKKYVLLEIIKKFLYETPVPLK